MELELQKRCSKTPPPFALQLHGVGSSKEFWSWGVWLEFLLELLEWSHAKQALSRIRPLSARAYISRMISRGGLKHQPPLQLFSIYINYSICIYYIYIL